MFFRLALLLGAMAVAGPVGAAPLTLDDAVRLALENQPILAAQRAAVEANRQTAVAEGQLPDPRLKLGVSNVPTNNFSLTQDSMTQSSVSIEQSFPGGNKRELRERRAQREAEESAAELAASTREITRNVAWAWLDLYYPLRADALIREQQQAFQQQIGAARISYRAGKSNQDEVLALQNMLNQLLDREVEISAQVTRARAGLARWIGKMADGDPPGTLPRTSPPPSLAQLDGQLEGHPEIRKLDQAAATAEAGLSLAKESRKPDWSVEVGYSKRGQAFSDMVSAQIAVDLPVFPANRQDRTISARQLDLDRARYQREDKLRALSAELAAGYADWQAASSRIAILRKQTLPDAAQRISAAIVAYQTGKSTMEKVFEAHHAELEARLQLLAQQVAQARAQAELDYFKKGEEQ